MLFFDILIPIYLWPKILKLCNQKPPKLTPYANLKSWWTPTIQRKLLWGEVLSDRTGEEPQKKFLRAQRFLNGQGSFKNRKNGAIVPVFQKTDHLFFPRQNWLVRTALASPHEGPKTKSDKPLAEIENRLRDMGFDEDFIKSEIRQLRALKSYEG